VTAPALDGVASAALAARWGVPRASFLATVGSTLDAVHELAAAGAPAGTVVLAGEQTAGRGREGRTWRSPAGGFWLGLLLRPTASDPGVYSIRAGLVLADAIDDLVGAAVAGLKWPNDVVIGGRKVAGILCEGRWQGGALQWLALGIGCNVTNAIPGDLTGVATRLADHHAGATRLALGDRLIPALARLGAGGLELTDAEVRAFARRDRLRGRELRAPRAGRAAGLARDGALLVETDRGPVPVREGHVELA